MKKVLFTTTIIIIALGLNLSATVAPALTAKQEHHRVQMNGEIATVINNGMPCYTHGTSFRSICLEINESLSFGEIPMVDVSDVTLNGNRSHPSADSLDSGMVCDHNNLDCHQAI